MTAHKQRLLFKRVYIMNFTYKLVAKDQDGKIHTKEGFSLMQLDVFARTNIKSKDYTIIKLN